MTRIFFMLHPRVFHLRRLRIPPFLGKKSSQGAISWRPASLSALAGPIIVQEYDSWTLLRLTSRTASQNEDLHRPLFFQST